MADQEAVRLNRYLASCGCGSRRACDEFIARGLVRVDGTVVEDLGRKIIPGQHRVEFRGSEVRPASFVYLLLHKPPNTVCTARDPEGRKTVFDCLPRQQARLFYVGRLDRNSEGLLLFTNDGDLANRLAHPRYHLPRTYEVTLDAALSADDLRAFKAGVRDSGELLKVLQVEALEKTTRGVRYRLVLGEGRNRHIRRMAEAVGRRVLRLVRMEMGPLQLGNLPPGQTRPLKDREIQILRQAAGL